MVRIYGPGPQEPEPLTPVPDLHGTLVDDVEGRPAGVVYGSLAEIGTGLVRYLDLALRGNRRHVLVPIGHARLETHPTGTRFRLRAATRDELEEIPPFDPTRPPTDGLQRRVLAELGRLFHGERYYAHPAYDHARLYAGENPIVFHAATTAQPSPLALLSELSGYRVARGEPDVRGWPLLSSDDVRAGTVTDLLVDPGAGKVRYVVVDTGDATPLLLPIGYLELETDRLRASGLSAQNLAALPRIKLAQLTRAHEDALRAALDTLLEGERRRFDRLDFRAA